MRLDCNVGAMELVPKCRAGPGGVQQVMVCRASRQQRLAAAHLCDERLLLWCGTGSVGACKGLWLEGLPA